MANLGLERLEPRERLRRAILLKRDIFFGDYEEIFRGKSLREEIFRIIMSIYEKKVYDH